MAEKVIKFYADWCQPCKTLSNMLSGIEVDLKNHNIEFENVNMDNNPELAEKYGVRNLPTIVLVSELNPETGLYEKIDGKHTGLITKDQLLKTVLGDGV